MVALADRQTGKTPGIPFGRAKKFLAPVRERPTELREDSAEAMSDTIAGAECYKAGFFEMSS
jgi:hypothetical protein